MCNDCTDAPPPRQHLQAACTGTIGGCSDAFRRREATADGAEQRIAQFGSSRGELWRAAAELVAEPVEP